MGEYDPFQKALQLVDEGRVIRQSNTFFKVFGETDDYDVYFDHSRVSCTCRYYSLHGCRVTKIKENGDREGYTKGAMCSHIMAVILQQGFLWRKEHGPKKIQYKRIAASSVQHEGECDQDKPS